MPRAPRGHAEGTLDAKGRAAVPTKFRPMFEGHDNLVLWEPQHQPYLLLTSDEYFDEIVEREFANVEKTDRADFIREVYSHMDDIELDNASRFIIHEKHNEKAGFRRSEKLFFIANKVYIEIWALETWKTRQAAKRREHALLDYTPDPVSRGIEQAALPPQEQDKPHE